MNYLSRINGIKSYFAGISRRIADHIQKYSNKYAAGATALATLAVAENASAEDLYFANTNKPPIVKTDPNAAENFYNPAALASPKTKNKQLQLKRLIADFSISGEAGDQFRQAGAGAKLTITPNIDSNAWRAVIEGSARIGTKEYPAGDDLNFGDFMAGARIGRYIDLRKFIEGTKSYAELGAIVEGTEYQKRTEMSNYRALAEAAVGFFSTKTGTNAKLTLAAGIGEDSLETSGTEQTDALTRILLDFQATQEIPGLNGPYGKLRLCFTGTNYLGRANAKVFAMDIGAGMHGKVFGLDAFVEALFSARQEQTDYFNRANLTKDIFGGRLLAGMQLTKEAQVKLGMEYDEELLFRIIAELSLRL